MVTRKPSGSQYHLPPNLMLFVCPDAYLSSDGPQPHFITIEFPRKVAIQVRYLIELYICELSHVACPETKYLFKFSS